jgi:cytochrome P450
MTTRQSRPGRLHSRDFIDLELYDPRVYSAGGIPHEELALLREKAPVCWVDEPAMFGWAEGPGYWLVLRHEDVVAVNFQSQVFSSQLGATQVRDPLPEDLAFQQRMLLNMDPPDHGRLRRTVNRAFTPRALASMEQTIAERSRAIVDALQGRTSCDFPQEVSKDLPLLTLAEIMGVPLEDRHLLFEWANRVIGFQDEKYSRGGMATDDAPPVDPRSRAALQDMFDYAHGLAKRKRAEPGTDVLSLLLVRGEDQEPLTDSEFENFFFLLAVAGNETLRNAVPGGMLALLQHPDQLAALRADRSLMPTAVEEMLRWVSPVMQFRRTATTDTVLGGQQILAGDKVVVSYAAANRDPAVFAEPGVFDIRRTPNKHLTFGIGPHFCLGTGLARMQMSAMFNEVLDRVHDLQSAGEPVRLQSNFQAGITSLPVTFRVAAA